MGKRSQASYNPTLTRYAQGYSQDQHARNALADFFAPRVVVPATLGNYKAYDNKQAFQVYDTARAVGGAAKRILWSTTDPSYNCKPQALEIPIDDSEEDAAGDLSGALQALREGKTRTLISSGIVGHEDKVLTVAKTLSAVGSKGVWSNTSNDPVAEIDEQIEAISIATGMMPNAIAFGIGAWRVFRNHPKVVDKQPGAAIIGVTETQAATMMLNPSIQVRVGVLSKDSAKMGATANKTNIVGNEVFIFVRSENPTEYDPSWLKTFTGGRGSIESVREYYDETCRSNILAIDWSEDIKVVSSIAAKRLSIT